MIKIPKAHVVALLLATGWLGCVCGPASAAVRIEGQVQAGAGPVSNSTVTLWAATAGEPKQLAQAQTGSNGQFLITADTTPGADASLYLVAKGGVPAINKGSGNNPAIALLTVLGNTPPANVVINEMTTVASVWTNAQFLDGAARPYARRPCTVAPPMRYFGPGEVRPRGRPPAAVLASC
jgi:hypothetical protein